MCPILHMSKNIIRSKNTGEGFLKEIYIYLNYLELFKINRLCRFYASIPCLN